MLQLGDTLRVNEHVCIVASDPSKNPDQVFLVALTTFEDYKDDSCLIDKGEHERVTHLTCVAYDFFENPLFSVAAMLGHAVGQPVTPEILARILQGAAGTERINMAAWLLLDDQGLV